MKFGCLLGVLLPSLALAQALLPAYPGARLTPIGEALAIDGQPLRIGYFTTTDSIAQVAGYFFDAWIRQGYPTLVDGDLRVEAVVCAFSTREGLQSSVVLARHQGKTVVFSALHDLWRPPVEPRAPLAPLEGTLLSQDWTTREPEPWAGRSALVEMDFADAVQALSAPLASQGFERVGGPRVSQTGHRQLWERQRGRARSRVAVAEIETGLLALMESEGEAR